MSDDDRPKGMMRSRREVLALLGATAAAALAGYSNAKPDSGGTAGGPACILTPEQTEGPYFVDEHLNRSDIRVDPSDGSVKAGLPLTLRLRIVSIGVSGCVPLAGAIVDIWHCDAQGVYSDATDPGFDTQGKKFLRGYQVTDESGGVLFTTIYPGWYPGRAVHIHFKVRAKAGSGRGQEFTSQLYFDDSITDRVHARKPYAGDARRRLKNDGDGLFRDGGRRLMLSLAEGARGYAGSFDVGLRMA